MIAQGPRAHGLSDDRNLITELLAQDLDGFHHAPRVWVSQEVRRYLDVTDISIDWLAHLNGGPVVLLFPLNLAAQRRRLLNNREHWHDAVKTQLRVARRRQTRHQLWNAVGIWKWRVHQVHQFHGRDGGWITDRCAVDWFPAQGSQHSLTTGHWTRILRFHTCNPSRLSFLKTTCTGFRAYFCALGADKTPRDAVSSCSRRTARTFKARTNNKPTNGSCV